MKSILKYPGAKNRLAPWICEYIPKHDVYVEPFAVAWRCFLISSAVTLRQLMTSMKK